MNNSKALDRSRDKTENDATRINFKNKSANKRIWVPNGILDMHKAKGYFD